MDIISRIDYMLDTVPPYYLTSNIYQNILKAWLIVTGEIDLSNEDLRNQLYIPTATWGLDYWEADYSIKHRPGDSYEIRRARLMARILGLGTFSKKAAVGLADAYSTKKNSKYVGIANEYAFTMELDIDGVVNYDDLVAAFEEDKPAHLEAVFEIIAKTEQIILKASSYNFGVDYPITNVLITADLPGRLHSNFINTGNTSYSFEVVYPVCNELIAG